MKEEIVRKRSKRTTNRPGKGMLADYMDEDWRKWLNTYNVTEINEMDETYYDYERN